MRQNQKTSRQRIQQLYYLAIFTSLLTLAILAVGCGSQTPPVADKGTPQPSPAAKPGPCILNLGETPIVISGGSFLIDLGKGRFNENPEGVFTLNVPDNLTTGYVYNDNPAGKLEDEINLGSLENSDITLWRYVSPTTSVQVATIESRDDPKSLTIKFKIPMKTFEKRQNLYSSQLFIRDSNYRIAKVTVKNLTNGPNAPDVPYDTGSGTWSSGKVAMEFFGKKY